jgi:hypothetical protein
MKNYTWLLVLVVIGLAGWYGYGILFPAPPPASNTGTAKKTTGTTAAKTTTPAADNNDEQTYSNLTYQDTQYQALAQRLYDAMGAFSNDMVIIDNVFKSLKTDDDVSALSDAFGTHSGFYLISAPLSSWVNVYLGASGKAEVNQILANNNISNQF